MSRKETHEPTIETLGLDCVFWSNTKNYKRARCLFPNPRLEGRLSCEGVIDDVCIWQLTGRTPRSLTAEQIRDVNRSLPSLTRARNLPPGDIKP